MSLAACPRTEGRSTKRVIRTTTACTSTGATAGSGRWGSSASARATSSPAMCARTLSPPASARTMGRRRPRSSRSPTGMGRLPMTGATSAPGSPRSLPSTCCQPVGRRRGKAPGARLALRRRVSPHPGAQVAGAGVEHHRARRPRIRLRLSQLAGTTRPPSGATARR